MEKRKLTDRLIRNYPQPEKRIEIYDEVVPGLAVRISSSGGKSFVYRYYFAGRNKRITIGSFTKWGIVEARAEAKRLDVDIKRGLDPAIERSKIKNTTMTIRELSELFIAGGLRDKRPRTEYEYKRLINKSIIPGIGNRSVTEISRRELAAFLHPIYEKTPTMGNKTRAILSCIFAYGIDHELLDMQNPITSLKKRYREKSRSVFLDDEQIVTLWKALDTQAEPTASIFRMLILCGQRLGETCQMRWDQLKGSEWHIPASIAKNKHEHTVPLSDAALEVIEGVRALSGNSPYVFASPTVPGQPVQWLQKARERLTEITGIEFRIHDLRRTTATKLAELGTERTVLAKILNHKSGGGDDLVTAVYDRYDYSKEKRRALQSWADELRGMVSGERRTANVYQL